MFPKRSRFPRPSSPHQAQSAERTQKPLARIPRRSSTANSGTRAERTHPSGFVRLQKFDVRDAEGQTLTVTDPLSRVTTNTYTNRGWTATVTDPLGNVATYTYSNTGKPVTQSDPSHSGGTLVSYVYDNDDRLIARTDALNHTTSLGYDAVSNKITVTDANSNVTTYAYDSRNRLTTLTDPLSHNTVFGYDSGGNRITVKDANNNVTTTQYDALNRATTLTDARGGVTVLAFDAAGRCKFPAGVQISEMACRRTRHA